ARGDRALPGRAGATAQGSRGGHALLQGALPRDRRRRQLGSRSRRGHRVTPLKTYSHLAGARRMPTEYEIVTSRLHYYVGRGFEIAAPLEAWYREKQSGSPLTCPDWDVFTDPRETTYTKYVDIQKDREAHVDAV